MAEEENLAESGSGFIGVYKITAKSSIDPHKWYYGFECIECKKQFAALDDPSGGTVQMPFVGDGIIRVACPHCKADRLYKPEQASVIHPPTQSE